MLHDVKHPRADLVETLRRLETLTAELDVLNDESAEQDQRLARLEQGLPQAGPRMAQYNNTGGSMPKGYWVSVYRTISDPEKLAAYNKLAGPAVKAGGGRTFVRGGRVVAHDAGIAERTVLVEFDSFEQAVAARESAAYQEALVALSDGVERDFRIVEGID